MYILLYSSLYLLITVLLFSSNFMGKSRLTRDGTVESGSRGQFLRRERGQGNINFPFSADYVQDWQPHPVDPYSCYMCDHTYIYIYIYILYIYRYTKSFELSRASISDPCSLVAPELFFKFLGPSTSFRARTCGSR